MERPDVPSALEWCAEQGLELDPCETSFFLWRERPGATPGSRMARWRSNLFAAMLRNLRSAADHFMLPPERGGRRNSCTSKMARTDQAMK